MKPPIYETFNSKKRKNFINFHKDRIIHETQAANWHKPIEILYVSDVQEIVDILFTEEKREFIAV